MQAAWEDAWAIAGKDAEAELAPYITAYDRAVQNELRNAAAQSPEALKAKLTEIKALDTSGSHSDLLLDKIATIDAGLIGQETPELRAAAQNFQLASVAWDAAQGNPTGVGFENAKTGFDSAKSEYVHQLGIFLHGRIEAGLASGKTLDQVTKELKAEYGGQFDPIINFEPKPSARGTRSRPG